MIDDFDSTPALSWLERLCCFLTGVDPKLLLQGPPRDRAAVVTIGLIMLGVFAWQATAFTFTGHMFLAAPGELRPELIAVAILFAGLIMLMDGYMVIKSSWWVLGIEQLKRGGLELPGYQAAKIKNAVLNVVRIALALIPAEFITLGVALFIFQAELVQILNADAVQRNAPLYQHIASQDDADTTQQTDRLKALRTALEQSTANAEALRADALRVPADDPELTALTGRVPALEAAVLEAERRVAALPPATSRAEATRRIIAQRLLGARRADLAKVQADQAAMRLRADTARQGHGSTVAGGLEGANRAIADYQTRITALSAEVVERAASRADRIRAAVERDATYVPPERGILARLQVLAKLGEDKWNFTFLLLLHAFFLGIELAAVLTKVLSSVPSSYAVRLAGEEYATEYETVDGVHKRISELGSGAPEAGMGGPEGSTDRQPPSLTVEAANDDAAVEDGTSDTEDRLRDGARAARAQAAARAKAKDRAKDPARDKPAEAADDADAAPATDDLTAGPVRRGPGRPPGARNKLRPDNDDRPPSEDGQDVA